MSAPRWEAGADLVVIGTGVAGLTAAITARQLGLRVLVVTKAAAGDGNTRWAQGGVAVVLPDEHDAEAGACDAFSARSGRPGAGVPQDTGAGACDAFSACSGRPGAGVPQDTADSVDRHIADTLVAGAGLCDADAVAAIIADGPAAVTRLRKLGAVFDAGAQGRLARTREGGHSTFRVVHAGGDATGAEVERALLAAARDDRIPLLEQHIAVDALRTPSGAVAGVLVLDGNGIPGVVRAPAVLLATGGLGQLYQATSNPEVATADGLALALRAGAVVGDVEFVQFHPTVLYTGRGARGRCPLVTEAVRGEGAVLVDLAGARVMAGVHPLEDLAPRDVVSAAITRRMAEIGTDHVLLDATHLGGEVFRRRFPTVHAACQAEGIDPAVEPIPVAPAAHFACGGVLSTVDGSTGIAGLYVAGEVARTGLHGANRLASNSLLEGLVVGERAARAVAADLALGLLGDPRLAEPAAVPATAVVDRDALQRAMSRHAGIGRDADGLCTALSVLEERSVHRPLRTHRAVEDAALAMAARVLLMAALERPESRGCHVRTDFPQRDNVGRSMALRLGADGWPQFVSSLAMADAA